VSLELWEWRRQVGEMYAAVRTAGGGQAAWTAWREARAALFASHPESPLAAGASPEWFPYDPAWRLEAAVEPAADAWWHTDEGVFRRIATAVFVPPVPAGNGPARLAVWWLEAYAGGVFLPFRDTTAGVSTYGGGRYLLDTAKGADLGHAGDRVVLDFNFAYHPSCAYDPRWACPLAPAENRLAFAVEAGERLTLSP